MFCCCISTSPIKGIPDWEWEFVPNTQEGRRKGHRSAACWSFRHQNAAVVLQQRK